MFLTPEVIDTIQSQLMGDLVLFLPELILCGGIVVLLLVRLFSALDRHHLGWFALAFTVSALLVSWTMWGLPDWMHQLLPKETSRMLVDLAQLAQPTGQVELFSGLLVYDHFAIFLRLFLFAFTALIIWLSMLTGIPDREDSADFYTLLLGATVGMALMAASNHLIMVFIAVEMASLPSYALAGFLKGRRQSSEAALKYVVYGGGAAGVMLYGISLIAGKFGTGYLPDLAKALPLAVAEPGLDPVLLLGMLFLLIGLAFKLAAVPFHFWCPDVFEGAAAEVAGFLSVASKGAALALLGRLALVLVGPFEPAQPPALAHYLVLALAFFAALTATFGNLAAYVQTNLKRLLAYSTIAHAGYMMMGLATLTAEGAGAVLFYLIAYLFMNLGAFAIVAFLRNRTGSEDLADFRGLVYRSPVMVVTLAVCLLSLLGLPPLAGFAAKFQIFSAVYHAAKDYSAGGQVALGNAMYALLAIGLLNTVFSAVYYIKVLKVMILDQPLEEVEGRAAAPLPVPAASALYASLLAAVIFLVGVAWNPLANASDAGVAVFKEGKPKVGPEVEAIRRGMMGGR